jgi:hypothetical protein
MFKVHQRAVIEQKLQQKLAQAQKTLREVKSRGWHSILLSSISPIDEGGEALKLVKIAAGYKQFNREYPNFDLEAKQEVYAVLRAAYDNRRFPPRRHLSKAQFERLLMLHLERL